MDQEQLKLSNALNSCNLTICFHIIWMTLSELCGSNETRNGPLLSNWLTRYIAVLHSMLPTVDQYHNMHLDIDCIKANHGIMSITLSFFF